jgi:hypothetical protein
MSGFDPGWLRLREPVDHRSRDPELAAKLAAHFAGRPEATIYDLGAGLGSNLRGTYALLPARQNWTLVDHDHALLPAACEEIANWADQARPTTSGIEAVKGGRSLHIEVKRHDLAAGPAPWGKGSPDLVTAAALFDLVSAEWIERFLSALTATRIAFYTALTHDALTEWSPPHPADAAMKSAFESHFGRDKGFGLSAGGAATSQLSDAFKRAGYIVERAPSPWVLGDRDAPLVAALADGWANAVRETGQVSESTIGDWVAARTAGDVACIVGHEDLLALPPSR